MEIYTSIASKRIIIYLESVRPTWKAYCIERLSLFKERQYQRLLPLLLYIVNYLNENFQTEISQSTCMRIYQLLGKNN